jgi:hypothetical protein
MAANLGDHTAMLWLIYSFLSQSSLSQNEKFPPFFTEFHRSFPNLTSEGYEVMHVYFIIYHKKFFMH